MDKMTPLPPERLPSPSPEMNLAPTPAYPSEPAPIFEERPRWLFLTKTAIGPLFLLLAMALKVVGIELDLEPVRELVDVILNTGTITAAALLTLIGRYLAGGKVVLWPPKK